MKNKVKLFILILIVIVLVLIIRATYSKYISESSADIERDIGQWIIKVNNTDITGVDEYGNPNVQEFTIDTFTWDDAEHIVEGKIAPSRGGSFEIIIDPTNTQVSFEYSLTIEKPKLKLDESLVTDVTDDDIIMRITNMSEKNGKPVTFTSDNTTFKNVVKRTKLLSEIVSDVESVRLDTIKVDFEWQNNENNNEKDSKIGSVYDNKISFPVKFQAIQYTGD